MHLPLSRLKASDIPHTLQHVLADELEQLSKFWYPNPAKLPLTYPCGLGCGQWMQTGAAL